MNKVLNINLGGYAFTIDDDAFEYLSVYLDSVRKRFSESEGRDEIVGDIEARLGELITTDLRSRTIVMLPDVEAAVQIMGKPEEFEGVSDGGPAPKTGSSKSSSGTGKTTANSSIKTGKRFFRDEEDKVVSGVCSGLAAYVGIQDPVWVRLSFVLLTFISAGFWIPGYLILSWVVPAAKTAADRLAMRGEPINVDSIAQEIETSFNRLGNQINEFGERINTSSRRGAGREAFATVMSALGQVFSMMVKMVGKFGVFIGIIVALALFLGLAASWVGGVVGLVTAAPYISYFSPFSNAGNWLGFSNGFFLLGIPIAGLVLTFSRVLFKTRTPRWLGAGLTAFWIVNLFSAITLGAFGAKDFRHGSTITQTIDLSNINSDTLRITAADMTNENGENLQIDGNGLSLEEDRLDFKGMVDVRVRRSENGRFVCAQAITARGATAVEASDNAAQTNFNVGVSGSTLRIPSGYSIPKGQKWRVQKVKINLEVPNGKCVIFDESIYGRAAADVELYADENGRNYISHRPGKVFRMTEDGLVCLDCPKFGDKEYKSEQNFENFIMEGNFTAEIRKSDDDGFSYRMEGTGTEAVKVVKTGDRITFTTNGKSAEKVHIILEARVFTSLVAENTGLVTIRGFEEGRASITAKGNSKIKANFDISNLKVALSGPVSLEMDGEGNELKANLSNGAVLEAPNFQLERADISASENSRARIFASDEVKSSADATSSIKVSGGAKEKED